MIGPNMTSDCVSSFTWNAEGRMAASAGTAYVYDGDNVLEEISSTGTMLARYTMGLGLDEPLAMLRGGATHYYGQDGLGTVTSLFATNGTVATSYSYSAFGQTAQTGSVVNPFRFTGREFDSETGLYYYRARYYDPRIGRFLSEDPVGFKGGINFYAYVENSPAFFTDPYGLWSTRHRQCNSAEYAACAAICGSRGVQSCMVPQTFRVVRLKDDLVLRKWADGPMSCSCNEDPNDPFCRRNPTLCAVALATAVCTLVATPWPDDVLIPPLIPLLVP
jgi:RHS repeat-associated protein